MVTYKYRYKVQFDKYIYIALVSTGICLAIYTGIYAVKYRTVIRGLTLQPARPNTEVETKKQ